MVSEPWYACGTTAVHRQAPMPALLHFCTPPLLAFSPPRPHLPSPPLLPLQAMDATLMNRVTKAPEIEKMIGNYPSGCSSASTSRYAKGTPQRRSQEWAQKIASWCC